LGAIATSEKLLSAFAGNPKLAKAVRRVGKVYNARGRPDKAMEIWMTNVEDSPDSVDAMLSQMDIIYAAIDISGVRLERLQTDECRLPRRQI